MEPNGTVDRSGNGSCSIGTFRRDFCPAAYLTIFVWGAAANSLSVYVFLRPRKRPGCAHVFMLNLAVSDLLFSATLPFRAHYYFRGSSWAFGDVACRVMSFSLYVNMYTSIYFLTMLSVVRCLATVHPFRLLHLASVRGAWGLCGATWVCIVASCSLLLRSGSEERGGVTTCLELGPGKVGKLLVLNHVALVLGFLLPFLTLGICCSLTVRVLLRVEIPEAGLRASHKKATATVVMAFVIFLLCFLPYHALRTLHLATWSAHSCGGGLHKAVVVTLALAAANSCLDPFLYYFTGENFKDRLRAVFGKEQPGQQRPSAHFPFVCS